MLLPSASPRSQLLPPKVRFARKGARRSSGHRLHTIRQIPGDEVRRPPSGDTSLICR